MQSLSFVVPLADGTLDTDPMWDGIVVSHSCEYTKIAKNGGYLLVAPVRPISEFDSDTAGKVRRGRYFSLWQLPPESPVDEECVADFRFIQPIHFRQLTNATHWACLAPEALDEFRGRLLEFLFRGALR